MIDLGWGELKTSLVTLKDDDFVSSADAGAHRKRFLAQYVDAFRQIEAAKPVEAQRALKNLSASIAAPSSATSARHSTS